MPLPLPPTLKGSFAPDHMDPLLILLYYTVIMTKYVKSYEKRCKNFGIDP